MNSVCIFNNKGGVGKTTLLCNLAASLKHHHNKKVLIIDADPQCNATSYFLDDTLLEEIYTDRDPQTIYSLVEPFKKGKGKIPDSLPIVYSSGFEVDLIPGDPRLSLAEDFLARDWLEARSGEERGIRSTLFLKETLDKCTDYDIVLFDVGPSLGAINRAVLISTDFFLVPMSSDIFSLQALKNIKTSLEEWKEDIESGIKRFTRNGSDVDFSWFTANEKAKFIGYVTQQYTAKSVEGVKVPVKAYESIIKKIPEHVKKYLAQPFSRHDAKVDFKIGEIPYLQSLIPLSQNAHKPIFLLESKDGVVGSHFAKVRDFDKFIEKLTFKFIKNMEVQK